MTPFRSLRPMLRTAARIASATPLNARRAWRAARARPLHTAAVSVTVALIVGAASVAFVVFDATVVRPLPFPGSDRLVMAFTMPPGMEDRRFRNPLHPIDLVRMRDRSRTLSALEGLFVREHAIATGTESRAHPVGHASAGLFDLLGLRLRDGRAFSAAEDRGQERVAVITYGFWRAAFGESSAIGQKLLIDGEPHIIVGVLDRRATTPFAPADLYTPLGVSETVLPNGFATYILGIGRLAPAATVESASAEIGEIMKALGREFPNTHDRWTAMVLSLHEVQFGDLRYVVVVMMAAALGVLLVGWGNVFNLTLAEALGRRSEFALSMALGASRTDIVATQIVGTSLIVGLGALAGLALGAGGLSLTRTFAGGALGPPESLHLALRTQAAVLGVTALAGLVAALVVAMRTSGEVTAGGAYRVVGSRWGRVGRIGLIATQVAVAATLTTGTIAFGRTLIRLQQVPTGFDPEGVLAVQLRMPAKLYATIPERGVAMSAFVESMRSIPGVTYVGSTTNPLSPGSAVATLIEVEGRPTPTGAPMPVQVRMLTGDYFSAVKIPIVAGRAINEHDAHDAPPVVVVSRLLADKLWPGVDAIGHRVRRPQVDPRWMTVVGIAGDVSDIRVGQPAEPILYTSYLQFNSEVAPVAIMVRTVGDPASVIPQVRRAISAYNPVQPVYRTNRLQAFVDASFAQARSRVFGLGAITLLGIALATVGVYGVVARTIAERVSEIGIRKALGATPWRASVSCIRDTAAGVLWGVVLAIPVALTVNHFVHRALRDVDSLPMRALAATLAGCAIVAALAAFIPLRRALALDPLVALRRV